MKDKETALSNAKLTPSQDYEGLCNRLRVRKIGRLEFFHGIKLLYASSRVPIAYDEIDRLSEEILKDNER